MEEDIITFCFFYAFLAKMVVKSVDSSYAPQQVQDSCTRSLRALYCRFKGFALSV